MGVSHRCRRHRGIRRLPGAGDHRMPSLAVVSASGRVKEVPVSRASLEATFLPKYSDAFLPVLVRGVAFR